MSKKAHTNPMNKKPTAKDTKPRSKLQQVQAQANWAIYFKLQPFHSCYTNKLVVSLETIDLINQYNDITAHLKDSISIDASMTKMFIRERDAKIKADFDKASKSIHDDCYKPSTNTPPKSVDIQCTQIEECGECNKCSTFCDVCGSWYPDHEPCDIH